MKCTMARRVTGTDAGVASGSQDVGFDVAPATDAGVAATSKTLSVAIGKGTIMFD